LRAEDGFDPTRAMTPARPADGTAPEASGEHMGQTVRFQEIMRRRAIIDESAVEQHAGLGLAQAGTGVLVSRAPVLRGDRAARNTVIRGWLRGRWPVPDGYPRG